MLGMMLILVPFLLIFAIGYMRDLRERHGDCFENCNAEGQIFTYIVRKSEAEILEELASGCVYTNMKYRWDAERREITLHEGMPNGCPEVTYSVQLIQQSSGTAMRICQLNHLRTVKGAPGRESRRGGNRYAWLQNEFWHQKLGAEPLRYRADMWK